MKNLLGNHELAPWGVHIAIVERVQREDLVRWARTEVEPQLVGPLPEEKKRQVIIRCFTFLLP